VLDRFVRTQDDEDVSLWGYITRALGWLLHVLFMPLHSTLKTMAKTWRQS
jgi:hypothetical protein